MDIRIKNKLWFVSMALILFSHSSCKMKNIPKKDPRYNYYLAREFKTHVFIECLNHGFNKSQAIKDVLAEDRSYSQDYALGGHYRFIDTLAMNLAIKIKQDSIIINKGYYDNLEEYGEMIGKRVFHICLNYYNSSELDSITRDRFFK